MLSSPPLETPTMARSVVDDIESLPHWARVAFAARCARNAMPLFLRFWPTATVQRQQYLAKAICLAEQSAAEGRRVDGLKAAEINAIRTAGVAILPLYGLGSKESLPVGENACLIASFVAKVAEWAAKAPQEGVSASAHAALEAYTFCRDAGQAAKAVVILRQSQTDLASLYRVAKKGRWSDNTSVPPAVFDLLAEEMPGKPWWQFW